MKIMDKWPIAVLISDIHYNINTLPLADAALRMAINTANDISVPVIIAGDLHDTKALLRAECIKAIKDTVKTAKFSPFILIGNHDRINEKGMDHSLHFFDVNEAEIIDDYYVLDGTGLIAYQPDLVELKNLVANTKQIIMHQGVKGSNYGDYIQDKTALDPKDLAGKRIISGHYHCRQTIPLPDNGAWTYLGNPYTLNFGEANDPAKGYHILYSDFTLSFVPTNLRKHVVIEWNALTNELKSSSNPVKGDLILVKYSNSLDKIYKITKDEIRNRLGLPEEFRLDLLPIDERKFSTDAPSYSTSLSTSDLIDDIIKTKYNDPDTVKVLIETWRTFK